MQLAALLHANHIQQIQAQPRPFINVASSQDKVVQEVKIQQSLLHGAHKQMEINLLLLRHLADSQAEINQP
jgi:hypothetical protein